ncbi:polysaccharide deacetylase family protein [Olivibacter sp. SDN3]|uniref:polysaccharide deacetylase family protein n=1 Tax=Olivibacter sp. SDN3 TaxID=2764720 RepID=UPI001C9E2711|nr:polysaccharide deacetylase family protein [Olivibacter sp. SDN3]
MIFSGDEYTEGLETILDVLKDNQVKASFFFTGRLYANRENKPSIERIINDGHYIGAHSDQHLLYCDWKKRDSLLVTEKEFSDDLNEVYRKMQAFGIDKQKAAYFLPPYEWYNSEISKWTTKHHLQLINFTPGTLTAADYTYPEMENSYRSSEVILNSIFHYEKESSTDLNGFIMLIHVGAGPKRKDKFYNKLPHLLNKLMEKGYNFKRIDELLI